VGPLHGLKVIELGGIGPGPFAGFVLSGLVQGSAWVHQGLPVWSVLPGLRPYMALRSVGGALIVVSFVLFAWNIVATIVRPRIASRPPIVVRAEAKA